MLELKNSLRDATTLTQRRRGANYRSVSGLRLSAYAESAQEIKALRKPLISAENAEKRICRSCNASASLNYRASVSPRLRVESNRIVQPLFFSGA